MWPQCQRLGVAAITYEPLADTDLSQFPNREPGELWKQLTGSQQASLRRLAYEMSPGDVIYVKDGTRVIDRGIITHSYSFDAQPRVVEPGGLPWAHQVSVAWSGTFHAVNMPQLGSEMTTVIELKPDEVARIERAAGIAPNGRSVTPPAHQSSGEPLLEDSYYRESPARLKEIVPRHNKLSNQFCEWLKTAHTLTAVQEQQRVDIRFCFGDRAVIAELKVCYGVGTTKSIREALGQLLEYNHYPARRPAECWLIVLDEEPSQEDRRYIETLREARALPVKLGWRTGRGFAFQPKWP